MKRKNVTFSDFLLIIIIIIISVVLFAFDFKALFLKSENISRIIISKNGSIIKKIYVTDGDIHYYTVSESDNFVIAYDGEGVWIVSSECRDKLCVRQGKLINTSGELVCLPLGYSVRLESGENPTVDGVVR